MAIAFDLESQVTTGSATSHTLSHTITGSNPILHVGVFVSGGGDFVTGVTWDGSSMTFLQKVISGPGSTGSIYVYELANPATGTKNVVVSLSSAKVCRIHAISHTDTNASGQPDTSSAVASVSSGTSITGSTTTLADNCWTIMFARNDSGTYSAGAGTTLRGSATSSNFFDSNSAKTPAGSVSLIAASSTAAHIAIILSIKPLSAGRNNNLSLLGVG